MTVVESPKGRASHNLGNRGAIPPFPPPGYCYIFFQNLSRKESSSPPAPSRFRLILRLEKTNRFQSSDGISPPKAPIATRKPLNAKETKSTQSLVTVIDTVLLHLPLQLVQQVQRLQRAKAVQVRFLDAVHDLLRQRREDGQLHRRGLASFIVGQMADRAPLGALMLGQYLARSVDDVGG